MIKITLLNSDSIYINPDLIEKITQHPHTVLYLTTDKNLIVKETADEVYERILAYRRKIIKVLTEVIEDEEA